MASRDRTQDSVEVFAEAPEGFELLGRAFDGLGFGLKELASIALDKDTHNFTHSPARSSDDFEALRSGAEQSDAAIPRHSYTRGKALEGLQVEAGEIELLKLLRGVGHRYIL
jgi:hypothetical protein